MMGEATYYLKADFPAGVDLDKITVQAQKALLGMAKMADAWQAIRMQDGSATLRAAKLKAEFPQVWEDFDLGELLIKDDDRSLNVFAGELCISEELNITHTKSQVQLSDYVWHFADWSRIERYFTKLGSTNVRSVSDEYTTPLDEW